MNQLLFNELQNVFQKSCQGKNIVGEMCTLDKKTSDAMTEIISNYIKNSIEHMYDFCKLEGVVSNVSNMFIEITMTICDFKTWLKTNHNIKWQPFKDLNVANMMVDAMFSVSLQDVPSAFAKNSNTLLENDESNDTFDCELEM